MANLTSQLAARQLALKMKLEPRLKREMSVLFTAISKDMRALYSVKGAILDAKEFEPEIQQILRQHYRRVAKVFGIALRQQLAKHFFIEESKGVDDEVDEALREFINTTTALRAKLIVETTQKEINGAISFGIGLQMQDDEAITTVDNEKVAADSQKEFNKKSKARAETIAVTETQTASEGAKEVEASTVAASAGALANLPPKNIVQKEWVAVLDSKTRDAHVLADGQRVGVDEAFTVGGERLKFPADTSLGATAKNIINCRCISAIVVENEPIASAIDTRVNPKTGFRDKPALEVIGA
jgi:hypothetical protein